MAPLESLPPDQRAVLQLVLQRGRTYDEIAAMLSIDRAAVRDRALQAFDEIGPPNRLTAERRALITDYLMGQLPPRVAEQIHERLASSPAERAWARALASDLSTLAKSPLPEIPSSLQQASEASPAAAPTPPVEPSEDVPPASEPPAGATRPRRRPPAERVPAPTGAQPAAAAGSGDAGDAGYGRRDSSGHADGPPTSRRGGAIMLIAGLLVVIVIIVVAIILTNNSGSSHSGSVAQTPPSTGQATGTGSASTPATGATSSTGTGTSSATTPTGATGASGTTGVQVLGQMKLKSPTGTTSPAGAAEIVKQNGKEGIVLLAQGVAPNTKHNAYAVWLYNGPGKAYRLGFVNPAVGASGKIQTATVLPPNATSYKYVLVTLETTPSAKVPGHVVLKGLLVLG